MQKTAILFTAIVGLAAVTGSAQATLISISPCTGAVACTITTTPPNPVTQNPNDGVLLAWDELQNVTLTEDLRVDRVFDPAASFITAAPGGDFFIKAGTIVSSHYFQWDPGNGSASTVEATITLDSQAFAFITATQNLFDSDAALGLPTVDYNDFGLRGLEAGDTTVFSGPNVDIRWTAGSPGDWTRLITAFSPGGNNGGSIPEPASLSLLGFGLAGMGWAARRRRRKAL